MTPLRTLVGALSFVPALVLPTMSSAYAVATPNDVPATGADSGTAEIEATHRRFGDASSVATSHYVPLLPCRLLDTRDDHDASAIDEHTLRITLDRCGIPRGATAVVATATVVRTDGTGWAVGYPAGSERPNAATINWQGPATRANTATITVGEDADGDPAIDVYRSNGLDGGDLVVDVSGAFAPARSARSGRFVPIASARRLLDTRLELGRLNPGDRVRVPLPLAIDDDASAIAVTVTAVRSDGPLYVTAYPAGGDRPTTSMLNTDAGGQTRAGMSIVPVSADGIDLYVSTGTDITVDMTGWFTGPGAREGVDGLFVPVDPRRLRDTRPEVHPIHTGGTIQIGLPADLEIEREGDDPLRPAAIAVSTTLISADERGFVTLYPARTERPGTASGYSLRNDLTAQFALTPVSDHGVAVYSERGTDVTVDLLGWFTGDHVDSTMDDPAPNRIDLQRVLAVGDSTMAGVRWYDAFAPLQGASWTFDGESCRKLVVPSCRGREGRRPPTAVEAIESRPDVFDVVVMMTGYNDGATDFARYVERVMGAARSQGVRRVVWLTYAREHRTDLGGADAWQVFDHQNAYLRWLAPQRDDLVVVEWAAAPRSRPEWFHDDGIHFTAEGSYGNADFMARAVAMATGQPCPVPYSEDGEPEMVCPDPGERAVPDMTDLYDVVPTTTQCWEVGDDRTPICVPDPYAARIDEDKISR